MSRRFWRTALILIVLASVALPAFPPAAAHPYHLQVANEVVSSPEAVDVDSWIAQSFLAGGSFFVSRVSLFVADVGTTGDPLSVSIRTDVGGVPATSNLTQGSAVGGTAGNWVDFDLSPWVQLTGGQTYWIVLRSTASNGNGYSYWNSGINDFTYPDGTGKGSSNGVSWMLALHDYNFRVYGFIQPSWSFLASASASRISAGQSVVFRMNFTNAGPGDSEALWVNVSLPSQLGYVSDDAAAIGGIRSGSYVFAFTAIAPGSHLFNLTASAVGGVPDGTVATTSITFDGKDHNGAPLSFVPWSLPVTIKSPRLSLSVTSTASAVDPGGTITLNATVSNIGGGTAFSVLLEGTVDPNATFVSASPFASYDPGTRTVGGTIPVVDEAKQGSLVWTVQVPPGMPDLARVRSDARATYRDSTGTALPTETASSLALVRSPVFAATIRPDRASAERGDEVAVTLYFNNTGSAAALQASASWTLGGYYALTALSPVTPFTPSGNGFDVSWTNVSVGPHALVARLQVLRGLVDGLSMPLQVRWAATDGNGNALPPATLSVSVTLRAPAPAVSLAPATVRIETGSILVVTLTLRNPGGAGAIGWLNLTLPSGLAFVDDNGTFASTVAGDRVSWSVPVLLAGSVATLGVRLRSTGGPGTVSVRFTFNYTDGRGSPVASLVSNPATVEIGSVTSLPVFAWIAIALAVIGAAVAVVLVWRRRGGRLVIDDAFVVDKGGLLLAHRSASFIQYQDEDILVGMFKAVQDFVKDSFSRGTDEQMKGLDFGDRKILIERGRTHFVAVVYRGLEAGVLRDRVRKLSLLIDDRFGDILADWNGSLEAVREITLVLPIVWGRAA